MNKKIIFEEVQFVEGLYKKNLKENDFSGSEFDGLGDEKNANNKNDSSSK